ncbi:hypothetical protein D1AOALGA4SA_6084 [Olavius algarvensis Delta 1 endosymbiont]|nr:hypothetical protein D1AOALGA4SA_6084 [Olavius algarvensis Delta 1 endosymbiont]
MHSSIYSQQVFFKKFLRLIGILARGPINIIEFACDRLACIFGRFFIEAENVKIFRCIDREWTHKRKNSHYISMIR